MRMRTARFCEPNTCTCATPLTVESCWASCVCAISSSTLSGTVVDDSVTNRIGWSAGFTFWYDGGMIPCGSVRSVALIAACTSCAAASTLRSSENWMVIDVDPSWLDDVMLSMPAMVENCFSSGVATEAAIVSGLAPGSDALTLMVGKSTLGRSLTGSVRHAERPPASRASISSVVMTGRRMNGATMSMVG
jgi:hypothetical protein